MVCLSRSHRILLPYVWGYVIFYRKWNQDLHYIFLLLRWRSFSCYWYHEYSLLHFHWWGFGRVFVFIVRRWFYWFLIFNININININIKSNIVCIIGVNANITTIINTTNNNTISKFSIIYIIMSLLNYVVINDSTDEFFVFITRR